MDAPVLAVGCPMWAHRPWATRYFGSTAPGEELRAYAGWCTAVEGNTTFYALPKPETVQRWAAQAPPGFRFCFKVPREMSHERRLRDVGAELETFCERLEPLAARMGPVSIQLPATFGPDDLGVLEAFVATVPRSLAGHDLRWAVEVRHADFEAEAPAERAVNDLLAAYDVDRILIDTRALFAGPRVTPGEIEAWERKPRLRVRPVATGPMPIVRFVGVTDAEANPTVVGAVGGRHRPVARGRAAAHVLHAHPRQRGVAGARTPFPRRGGGAGGRPRAAARAAPSPHPALAVRRIGRRRRWCAPLDPTSETEVV